jgi:hypothetical protein
MPAHQPSTSPGDTNSMLAFGRWITNHHHSAARAEPAAVFKTVGQIEIANFSEGLDDLLLGGVCNFHFVLCGHGPIYVGGTNEPEFTGEMSVVGLTIVVPNGSWASRQSVVGIYDVSSFCMAARLLATVALLELGHRG